MTQLRTQWIGYATGLWSLAYGALGAWWALGGAGFPFGVGDPELMAEPEIAFRVSLLGRATPEVAGWIIAVLGLLGAAAAFLMARGANRPGQKPVLTGVGLVFAVGLGILVQDFRTLVVVAYTPVLAVSKPLFGWPEGAGWGDLYLTPRLHLLMLLLAGIAWAVTTAGYRARLAGGSTHSEALQRWGKAATWTAVAMPMLYCATRWAWALGFSLGIDPDMYREGQEDGLWFAGAALATLGLGGAVLTMGLVQRWGEVFPRWMIGLRGRRVPPMLAVVPAVIVGALVASAGMMYVRLVAIEGVAPDTWPLNLPEVLFTVWGAALIVAALAYRQRRLAAEALERVEDRGGLECAPQS